MRARILIVAFLFSVYPFALFAASSEDDIRSTFDRFVAAQNAHDLKAVEGLLADSPSFLWITKGNAVWGRAEALKKFESLYKGTWKLEPDTASFRVVSLTPAVAQIFVPITFTIGPEGAEPQQTKFLMNQVLTKSGDAWVVSSILPIPVPPPAK